MTTNEANASPIQIKVLVNAEVNFNQNPETAAELARAAAGCFHVRADQIRLYQLQALDPTQPIANGEFACQIESSSRLCIYDIERMLTERKHLEHNLNRAMETLVTVSHLHSAKQKEFESNLTTVKQQHLKETEELQNKVQHMQLQLDAAKKKLEQYQKWRGASRTQIEKLRQDFARFKSDLDRVRTE